MLRTLFSSRLLHRAGAFGRQFSTPTPPPTCTATPWPWSFLKPVYFVHAGNLLILAAINQSDMLNLRVLSVVASGCGITYNLLQPQPLVAPAVWGGFFVCCHLYYIQKLLREREDLTMCPEQEKVYCSTFMRYGFTPRHFLDLLEQARPRWRDFKAGEYIQRRGDPMREVHYVVEGEVDILSSTDDLHTKIRPGKGGWLGEFFDPNAPANHWDEDQSHSLPVSYQCAAAACRTMALPRKALHKAIKENPRVEQAAARAEIGDLWGKLHRAPAQARRRTYQAMLQVALSDGKLDDSERSMLEAFRARHGVADEEHVAFLAETGWTPEEFASGGRAVAKRGAEKKEGRGGGGGEGEGGKCL